MSTRRDAVRNRQRVFDAAVAVYGRRGPGFEIREVAERAGVGVGTVYRHFADREQLIDAIAQPFFEEVVRLLRKAGIDDSAEPRLVVFVRAYAALIARRGVRGHCSWDSAASRPLRLEFRAILAQFLDEGQRDGRLRTDLTREDAASLLRTVALLVDATVSAPAIWRRQLELLIAGVVSGPPSALRERAIEPEEWDALVGTPT